MTASAPPLALMIVNSGTRWLPEHLNLRFKVGAGVPPKGADWPTAAILRSASKWWASPVEESSHRPIKVVEKLSQPDGRPW